MVSLYDALWQLKNIGVLDIILPFMLIFTIVYAVLQQTHILGEGKKNFNITIAFVMGLGVVIPHVTNSYRGFDPVDLINSALPNVSVWLVGILSVLILIGLFFGKSFSFANSGMLSTWIVVGAIIVVGYIFLNSANLALDIPFISDPVVQGLVIFLLVFFLIVKFITGDDEKKEGEGFFSNLVKEVEKLPNKK